MAAYTLPRVEAVEVGIPYERVKQGMVKAYIQGMSDQRMYGEDDLGLERLTIEQIEEKL